FEKETRNPFDSGRRYESRIQRAPDYSTITGQLCFAHTDGGLWVLRYAPLGQEDPNGGGVVLPRTRLMDPYREGDPVQGPGEDVLVKVSGEIVEAKASRPRGAPLSRVRSIELVERTNAPTK